MLIHDSVCKLTHLLFVVSDLHSHDRETIQLLVKLLVSADLLDVFRVQTSVIFLLIFCKIFVIDFTRFYVTG